jgi:hypothetical protein
MKKNTLLLLPLISFLICCNSGKKADINPVVQEEKTITVDDRFQKISSITLSELSTVFVFASGDELYILEKWKVQE